MPILPLIDLLLLAGTGSLFVGFLLKAIAITTRFRPSILGFSSIDFVLIAGVCMGFALVLAARTWVKLNEPRALALQRERMEARFRAEDRELVRAADALEQVEGELERSWRAAEPDGAAHGAQRALRS